MNYISEEENIEKKLHKAVVYDIDRNKQHLREINDVLREKYKKAGGRKKTHYDDNDFGIGDDDESEGYELDFLWRLLQDFDKNIELNPKTVYDWAILLDKKAKEKHWDWSRPIQVKLFTGFYAEPFRKVIVKPEMVEYIETYEDDVKKSYHKLESIEKWLKEKNIQSYKMNHEEWVFEIATYFYLFQNEILITPSRPILFTDLVFRPLNNEVKRPFYELVHYRIESKEIIKKMDELHDIEKNKRKTNRILTKVLKENNINNLRIIDLDYDQYLFLLSSYWLEYKDEFKNDDVFHPQKKETELEPHRVDVYTINMNSIKRFGNYIKCSKKEEYIKELENVKSWASESKKIDTFENMNDYDWLYLIKEYHKEQNIEILESTIYFPKSNKNKSYSFNHYIIDLTKNFDILDLMYFSSDEEDTNF